MQISQISDWRWNTALSATYEKLLGAIGTEEFGSTVRDSILSGTRGARRIYLYDATGREHSSLQYFSCEPAVAALFPAYNNQYMRLDPMGEAFLAAPEPTNMAMLRVRPSDIRSPGLRRQFYDSQEIIERVSIVQRGPNSWRGMNVARHLSDGEFSDDELTSLVGLASIVLPMLPLNDRTRVTPHVLTVPQLEDRFASRYPELTLRERQVCARAAIGMSVEATALDLEVAKTSVLTYRRRAYGRLRVTSPFELCSLVTH